MSDFPKFCTSCGASLEPGQKFCTSCGAAVSSDDEKHHLGTASSGVPLGSSSYEPGNTSPMPVVDSSYSFDNTQVIPSVDETTRQYLQPHNAPSVMTVDQSSNSAKRPLVVIIAVLAIAVCALVGVLIGVFSSNTNQSATPESASSQPSSSEETHAESSSGANSEAAKNDSSSDKAIYDTLSGYYTRLSAYDDKIASCAKTFNANYLSKDMSKRSSSASAASSLQDDIEKDYSALKNITIPSNSRYASSYSAMLTCYYDCTQRIGAIVESWNNSLQYSDPTGHEDAICEPLSRDKSGDNNKYYTEFKQTYPSAKPASPTE